MLTSFTTVILTLVEFTLVLNSAAMIRVLDILKSKKPPESKKNKSEMENISEVTIVFMFRYLIFFNVQVSLKLEL